MKNYDRCSRNLFNYNCIWWHLTTQAGGLSSILGGAKIVALVF